MLEQDPTTLAQSESGLIAPEINASIQFFYFDNANTSLWACLHRAPCEKRRDCVIVLCPPVAFEYARGHNTYKRWAARLANIGFDVIRFDYFGTGDSFGDFRDATVARWLSDIQAVRREALGRCASQRLCLMGLGFGATLAALACREHSGDRDSMCLDGLVLWNPIVVGRSYLDAMGAAHRRLLISVRRRWLGPTQAATELMGFSYSRELLCEMRGINLDTMPSPQAQRTLILDTNGSRPATALQGWGDSSHPVDNLSVADLDPLAADPYFGNVPNKGIHAVLQWARKALQ
jgi:pimeloyl-ACP methyl ester carboxylesterase